MPGPGVVRRPPAPYCEDCLDEDTPSPYAEYRAPANVAVKRSKSAEFDSNAVADKKNHDGSDSGYSSIPGTSDTTSLKGGDLHIDTAPIERERQPYSLTPNRPDEPSLSPTKTKPPKMDKTAKQPTRFVHAYGKCWVCDQYGYHFDISKEIPRPATAAPTQTQKPGKSPAPKARSKDDGEGRPSASRRSSSTASKRDSKLPNWFMPPGAYPFQPSPVEYNHPMLAQQWQPQPNPPMPPPPQYSQHLHPYASQTPVSGPFTQRPDYFNRHPQYTTSAEPFSADFARKGHEQKTQLQRMSSKARKEKKENDLSRAASREPRPRAITTKTVRSAQADRESMPPPPRPKQEPTRPTIRKTQTEYPVYSVAQPNRRSVFYDDDDDDDDEEEEEVTAPQEVQAFIAKQRNTLPRPPGAFPITSDTAERPRQRKMSSYSTSSGTVFVASSSQRDLPRKGTNQTLQRVHTEAEDYVSKAHKQKETEAGVEAYVAKTKMQRPAELEDIAVPRPRTRADIDLHDYKAFNRRTLMNPLNLTAETLKKLEYTAPGSDAGSVHSKHSSGESAAGRTRASTNTTGNFRTNITTENGFHLSIPADCGDVPFHIEFGNFRLSNQPVREEERPRELKRIERAPSEVSHASRRSFTSSSGGSATKDHQALTPWHQKPKASKRSSRAASTNRPDKREIRSIDYSPDDDDDAESYYLDYRP